MHEFCIIGLVEKIQLRLSCEERPGEIAAQSGVSCGQIHVWTSTVPLGQDVCAAARLRGRPMMF